MNTHHADGDATGALRRLLEARYVGVLVTSADGQPYPSLVAFAAADDLGELLFATPRDTRKYANMQKNSRVAMLIDDRSNAAADIQGAVAATAIGSATELPDEARKSWLKKYLARHPHLSDFIQSDRTVLVRMTVEKYVVVRQFQNVVEIPVEDGAVE